MNSIKNKIIGEIIRVEGGYSNNVNDSGGETNFGITVAIARSAGYFGEMFDLPVQIAFDIYAERYWDSVKASDMPESIAEEVVDTAVNMGISRAGKFLQRSLNALNNQEKHYPDIVVDGNIGPATIKALDAYLVKRNGVTLTKMLNCLQGAFYVELAERREKDESFIYGWFKNRVNL